MEEPHVQSLEDRVRPSWSGQQGTWRNGGGPYGSEVAQEVAGAGGRAEGLDFGSAGSGEWGHVQMGVS